MNTWLKMFGCLVMAFMLLCSTFVIAEEAAPCADSVFNSVTTNLKSSKTVSFRCVTYGVKSSISVTACWLEVQQTDGTWRYVRSLTPPSDVAEGMFSFVTSMDYYDCIGSGTYRIWATYVADGHAVTRVSNERTFSH